MYTNFFIFYFFFVSIFLSFFFKSTSFKKTISYIIEEVVNLRISGLSSIFCKFRLKSLKLLYFRSLFLGGFYYFYFIFMYKFFVNIYMFCQKHSLFKTRILGFYFFKIKKIVFRVKKKFVY
jgi:hypothetical protein